MPCLERRNQCAEIKLRAERRAGEMLGEVIHRGGKPNTHGGRLVDFGIDQNQSKRWRLEASVSEDVFERYLAEKKDAGGSNYAGRRSKRTWCPFERLWSPRMAVSARSRPRPYPTPKLTDLPGFARLAETMKTIYIASLVALLLFLASHFNILLRLKRMLDWTNW